MGPKLKKKIQFKCQILGIFPEYSVFSRILGILQNIRFRQNIRHFESAEYSVSADSENMGFGRSLLHSIHDMIENGVRHGTTTYNLL